MQKMLKNLKELKIIDSQKLEQNETHTLDSIQILRQMKRAGPSIPIATDFCLPHSEGHRDFQLILLLLTVLIAGVGFGIGNVIVLLISAAI